MRRNRNWERSLGVVGITPGWVIDRLFLAEGGDAIDLGGETGGDRGAEDTGRDQGDGGGREEARIPGIDAVGEQVDQRADG